MNFKVDWPMVSVVCCAKKKNKKKKKKVLWNGVSSSGNLLSEKPKEEKTERKRTITMKQSAELKHAGPVSSPHRFDSAHC